MIKRCRVVETEYHHLNMGRAVRIRVMLSMLALLRLNESCTLKGSVPRMGTPLKLANESNNNVEDYLSQQNLLRVASYKGII